MRGEQRTQRRHLDDVLLRHSHLIEQLRQLLLQSILPLRVHLLLPHLHPLDAYRARDAIVVRSRRTRPRVVVSRPRRRALPLTLAFGAFQRRREPRLSHLIERPRHVVQRLTQNQPDPVQVRRALRRPRQRPAVPRVFHRVSRARHAPLTLPDGFRRLRLERVPLPIARALVPSAVFLHVRPRRLQRDRRRPRVRAHRLARRDFRIRPRIRPRFLHARADVDAVDARDGRGRRRAHRRELRRAIAHGDARDDPRGARFVANSRLKIIHLKNAR